MVKRIPLGGKHGQGKFALVDDEDYELLIQCSWHATPMGYVSGGARASRILGHHFMHRVVNGTPDGVHTDHIDRNPLNNCRSNLRDVTPSQNMMNTTVRKNKVSKYKGVWWNSRVRFWYGAINVDGQPINLGNFDTQREAAIAYNEAAIKYFGEFANLNDIPNEDPSDKPVFKKRPRRGGSSIYSGVYLHYGNYTVHMRIDGVAANFGSFPDEKFAARVYDAAAIKKFDKDAIRHVNFSESVHSPLDLDSRYVFKAPSKSNSGYRCVSRAKNQTKWYVGWSMNGVKVQYPFDTPEQAAEHWDKLNLIYNDNICTLLNFPERLPDYLAEIGDQIISPKPILIPDLD